MKINKIGICIFDNDFTFTFVGVLEAFATLKINNELEDTNNRLGFTKKQIIQIIRKLVEPMYLMWQSNNFYPSDKELKQTTNYLLEKLDEKHVFVNEEVDNFIKENDNWCNGEFVFIDLNSADQQVQRSCLSYISNI